MIIHHDHEYDKQNEMIISCPIIVVQGTPYQRAIETPPGKELPEDKIKAAILHSSDHDHDHDHLDKTS